MKTRPKLLRLITPPPIAPGNLLQGPNLNGITRKALGLHLAKSVPTSTPRTCPFNLQCVCIHPSRPLMAYSLVPDGPDRREYPESVVVQHAKTRAVMWSMSIGEMASMLFEYEVVADRMSEQRQHKFLKEMGQIQRLDFFDPSTLYWSGHGAIGSPAELEKRWSYLFVQFTNRIVICNLRQHSVSLATSKADAKGTPYKSLLAHITRDSLGAGISSNAIPVSQNRMVVGTADGCLKLYDWKANVVIQSVKSILSSKSDYIVEICSANKFRTPEEYSKASRRLVCLTKKGSTYLVELKVTGNIVHDISPPICKFEGGSVPTSMSKQDDEHGSMEHIFVQYCGFRDILMRSHPSKTKGKLLVWDMGNISEPNAKQKKKNEPVKSDPLLVLQFPYETTHTIFPGWFHESLPMESLACAAVTKEGDFHVLVSPLYNSGSTTKNAFSAFTVFSVDLNQVLQRDLDLPEENKLQIKVQSIYCSPLRDSSVFYFGTNIGMVMVKMADGNIIPVPGSRHVHLNANTGSLGKAVFSVKGPEIIYGSLEPKAGPTAVNPIGKMESKNDIVVYESPPPLHLPPEIYKRPVRFPPCFLPSPSRNYLCCFWKEEMRYEVLHVSSMLERVTSRIQSGTSPVVASGNGVASFAWVGDNDVFCLLYNPEQDLALQMGIDLSAPTESLRRQLAQVTDLKMKTKLKKLASLKTVTSGAKAVGSLTGKLKSLEGIKDIAKGTQKATFGTVKGVTKTVKGTTKVAVKGTTKLAVGTAKVGFGATKRAAGGTKRVFGLVGRKKRTQASESLANAGQDEEEETSPKAHVSLESMGGNAELNDDMEMAAAGRDLPWVELRALVGDAGSTISNLGQLTLRSGNRNPPSILFGGPVLCVGSKLDDHDEGIAYFYTRVKDSSEERSADYVSSGPAFPCPDLVAWDDEGRLCAVVIQSRVSIYLSDEPDFVMLGTTRVGSAAECDVQVISARFIHGALYCTTQSSIQCIFLGDLEDGVCHLDVFTLASSDVPTLPSSSVVSDHDSLTPSTIPMPLNHSTVLGYQNGSLVVSTIAGVLAIPLGAPLLRIGSLIAAGHHQRAELWFDAIPETDHEALGSFLERRGVPEMALELSGLSLETKVDISMRYGLVDHLETLLSRCGLKGLRAIDMSRGMSANIFGPEDYGTSMVVCVGAYLLSHGKIEVVRRLASECLLAGEEGKREAFVLASLLLSIDGSDSKRLIQQAVVESEGDNEDWLVGNFVREHVL